MAATDLFDLCSEWLEVLKVAAASTPGGAIANAYVSPGPPAWDCEQLTVHAGGASEGDTLPLSPPLSPGHRDFVQGAVHLVNMTATILRCGAVPNNDGKISLDELEETARRIDADVWAAWNHTRSRHLDGTLFFSPSSRRELIYEAAIPLTAEGGVYGWEIPIRVQLGGYSVPAPRKGDSLVQPR